MKNHIKKFLLLVLLVLCTGSLDSCKKYLDRNTLADIKPTDPYKNFRNFQGFTEELYNCLPLLSANNGHNSWNLGEDEFWEVGEQRIMAYQVDVGNYPAWNQVFYSMFSNNPFVDIAGTTSSKGALWFQCFYAIRKCNLGLANLDKMVDATAEEKNLIAGQLYFFRGFYHHTIMEYWGGLPYLDQVYPIDQIIKVPRLSYQASADKVAADMQKAADLLPVDWDATVAGATTKTLNNQRINKIMALCYMGKSLLWAGSPLMNRESTGSATYNTAYCKKAADAFAQALQIIDATGRYALAPFSQIRDLIYTYNKGGQLPGLKEAILLENLSSAGPGRFRNNQASDYRPTTILTTGIKVYPTANYVDYYGMANGLPIPDIEKPDAESGYDPSYPWRDRDPRFYNDILIDGERCIQNGGAVGNDEYRVYASLFTGGKMRTVDGAKKVWTGYMNSKIVTKLLNDFDGFRENNTVVLSLMRLADVYLLYAEATANGYGTPQSTATGYSLTAVDAVNKVRQRAGVANVAAKFLGSTTSFMSEVRRERAVELAFEGHRFIDLRRWLLVTERPYTYKKGVEFDRATPNAQVYADPRNAKVSNLRETVLVERPLVQRHYWFPFLQADINMYAEFKQNPGW